MRSNLLPLLVFSLLASTLPAAQPVGTSPAFHGPTGLVVYSLRNQLKENGAAALDFAQEQGFVEVEIGLESHFGLTQAQMKEALAKRGLKPVGAHAGSDFLLKQTDKAVEIANDLGLKYVGVAWAPHKNPMDEAQTLKIAEDFNTIGKRLKEKGIQFYYHNHGYEFQPYKDGETLFDLLAQKTDPDLVKFEMDVMWTVFPGQDPVKLLKKYPGRWIMMHLKDLKKGVEGNLSGGTDTKNDVVLGSGQVDYPAVLKAAQEIGVKHYFIEDESPDVLKQIPQSLKFLSGIAF
ncbi:MAG: sugar phosphate isomerase/epimerase [Verrucomicrobiota bacterium]|jgi:sugar phosphate isomerase/epimerase|nr:sugar phosphate isomerase/epimerase [Verrucomicrobiota bacterium]